MKIKKRKRIRWKNVVIAIIFLICLTTAIISIINIFMWKVDSDNVKEQLKDIEKINPIEEVEDTENTEIIPQEEEIPQANPYWDYIKINLINVDFPASFCPYIKFIPSLKFISFSFNFP